MNCCCSPSAMLGSAGETSIDTSSAAVTVRVVEPRTAPEVAAINVEPVAAELARPSEAAALLIVATKASELDQVTEVVMSCVLASV